MYKKDTLDIVITAWALDSYLELKHKRVFIQDEYRNTIRPDVLLLKEYPDNPKFGQGKFWSVATDKSHNTIQNGYKMKWHQVGNGKVQLRLPVGIFSTAFLCEAYAKRDDKYEKRRMARLKVHLELIRREQYTECGRLA